MEKTLRLLLLNSKGPGGGGARQAFQLACRMRERGYTVWFGSRPGQGWEAMCQEAGLPFQPFLLRHLADWKSVRAIRAFCQEKQIDVVQVQKGTEFALALGALWKLPEVGLIAYRGVSFPLDRWNSIKYRLKRVDCIVVVSESLKRDLAAFHIPEDKLAVIYGGVDLSRFDLSKVDATRVWEEFGIQPDELVIACIAHLRVWKGHKDLLEAFPIVLREFPKAHLLCAGRFHEPVASELRGIIAKHGWDREVLLLGEREDVPDLLTASTLSVNCSTGGEGLTGALRESLALEVPVVATRVAGNPELIEDGVTGLLVPPGNPPALAEALLRLLRAPEDARRMALAGKHRVAEQFSLESQVAGWDRLYRKVAANRKKGYKLT